MQLIKNQIIESIYLCQVWNQNFESVNLVNEGGKFNKSCYNIEETVEKNLIRLMRYARKDVFPNYTLVNQRVNSFTGWIAVKKESELSQNLTMLCEDLNVYNVVPEILTGYNYYDLRELEVKLCGIIEKCFNDEEENYLILGSKPLPVLKQEIVEANQRSSNFQESSFIRPSENYQHQQEDSTNPSSFIVEAETQIQ